MRLLVEAGEGCKAMMDVEMRDLSCRRLQVGEIWGFVAKKQRQIKEGDDRSRVGDQWTFVALDPETKLVPYPAQPSHGGWREQASVDA